MVGNDVENALLFIGLAQTLEKEASALTQQESWRNPKRAAHLHKQAADAFEQAAFLLEDTNTGKLFRQATDAAAEARKRSDRLSK